MSKRIHIRPTRRKDAEGNVIGYAHVRDPVTRAPLPKEGKGVPETSFWVRRLKDGDVELTPADEIPGAAAAAPTPPIARSPSRPLVPPPAPTFDDAPTDTEPGDDDDVAGEDEE